MPQRQKQTLPKDDVRSKLSRWTAPWTVTCYVRTRKNQIFTCSEEKPINFNLIQHVTFEIAGSTKGDFFNFQKTILFYPYKEKLVLFYEICNLLWLFLPQFRGLLSIIPSLEGLPIYYSKNIILPSLTSRKTKGVPTPFKSR